jgi:hypothetical protein
LSHITATDSTKIIPQSGLLALQNSIGEWCPGCEFVEGQAHYKTWKDNHKGQLVGDWPLPEGWTADQIGEGAHHVIRLTDERLAELGIKREAGTAPYEIGVVPVKVERDGEGNVISTVYDDEGTEYILMTDWYNSGNGLCKEKGIGVRKTTVDPKTKEKKESVFDELYMFYQMEQKKLDSERVGDKIEFEEQPDGTYVAAVNTVARTGA